MTPPWLQRRRFEVTSGRCSSLRLPFLTRCSDRVHRRSTSVMHPPQLARRASYRESQRRTPSRLPARRPVAQHATAPTLRVRSERATVPEQQGHSGMAGQCRWGTPTAPFRGTLIRLPAGNRLRGVRCADLACRTFSRPCRRASLSRRPRRDEVTSRTHTALDLQTRSSQLLSCNVVLARICSRRSCRVTLPATSSTREATTRPGAHHSTFRPTGSNETSAYSTTGIQLATIWSPDDAPVDQQSEAVAAPNSGALDLVGMVLGDRIGADAHGEQRGSYARAQRPARVAAPSRPAYSAFDFLLFIHPCTQPAFGAAGSDFRHAIRAAAKSPASAAAAATDTSGGVCCRGGKHQSFSCAIRSCDAVEAFGSAHPLQLERHKLLG